MVVVDRVFYVTSGHVGVSVPVEEVRNEWADPLGICTVRVLACTRTQAHRPAGGASGDSVQDQGFRKRDDFLRSV